MLDENDFKNCIMNTPLISIDLIVKDLDGSILLGKRNNRPAKGYWFVPGGRIFKDESFEDAFKRILRSELGIDLQMTRFNGIYQHLYQDNFFDDSFSTHYIALAYEIKLSNNSFEFPNEQHSDYRWFTREEVLENSKVHEHTKWYFLKSRSADTFLSEGDQIV